jgi:hypothetical protein
MAEGELVQNVWLVPVDKIVWKGSLRKFSDDEIQELAASAFSLPTASFNTT